MTDAPRDDADTPHSTPAAPSTPAARRVVIVGAGLAGLIAAERLGAAGWSPTVVERAKAIGGRFATRSIGRAVFDHGAQFFTVRSEEFAEAVSDWVEAGAVGEWCRGFDEEDGYPRYRGEGGMAPLARHLAERARSVGAEIVTGVGTTAVIGHADGLTVTHDHWQREPDEADAVILTPPAPLSIALLDAGGLSLAVPALRELRYHRVLALLATVPGDHALSLPAPGATQNPSDPAFSFIADNQTKGISPERAITFHTAHARSAELWDRTDKEVLDTLVPAAASAIGIAPDHFGEVQLRRWHHTGPVEPWPERTVVAARAPGGAPVLVAGDAFGGPKVEGAFRSGLAAADHLLGA